MIKKIAVSAILCFLLIGSQVWAQNQPRRVLTEQDVINFAKNFDEIVEDFNRINFRFDVEDFISLGNNTSVDDIVNNIKDIETINRILNKHGISDPEPFRKAVVISYAFVIETLTREILNIPELTMFIQMMHGTNDPISQMRNSIHPADLALVQKHYNMYRELLMHVPIMP
ncbi:MAG: hypothetical protein FWC36_09700 [Spirochaetes bacterium]|nr:hypothetical protein [Spirochaetota bacterium]